MSRTPPTVCVALPVLNAADYLDDAIASVVAQKGVDLDLRVVDNGSSDGSVAIAERWAIADARVSVAVNDVDVHYYGSLNRILAETRAEFYVPFAGDDLMLPGNLARKTEVLRATGAGFVHGSATIIDEGGVAQRVEPDHRALPSLVDAPDFFTLLAPQNCVSCQSVLARTDALREIGGFDARTKYASDWLTWMRLSLRHRVATMAEPLVLNRVHSASGTSIANAIGANGRDLPATLDRVFLDEVMPPAWSGLRDPIVARLCAIVAPTLHADGVRRVDRGWAAYMLMGDAVLRQAHDPALRGRYFDFVAAAGLVPPAIPFDAVAELPLDAGEAARLGAEAERLGDLLGRLLVASPRERLDDAIGLLEPVFAASELDVAVVPAADTRELVIPGRLVLARWGSPLVALAEASGVPVHPYGAPEPFARPADLSMWETVDPARCLP